MTCEWGSGFPPDISKHICGANCSGHSEKPATQPAARHEGRDTSHLADCHAIGGSPDPTMLSLLQNYATPCSPGK